MKIVLNVLLALTFIFPLSAVWADDSEGVNVERQKLLIKYNEIKEMLRKSSFHIPIHLETEDGKEGSRGDVYGVLAYPYKTIAQELHSPHAWCDIIILHINVKMCEVIKHNEGLDELVKVYVGKKYYQSPEDSEDMLYKYGVTKNTNNYLELSFKADKGPLGTSGYVIEAEFTPLDENTTLIHFAYTYHYGFSARMAVRTYLSTLGSGKVGFTITGYDKNNEPQYVKGFQGIIERNSMRYFLAILAYLDGINVPADKRFELRMERWFEYTMQYRRQLYEFDKEEYLDSKRQEWANQMQAQRKQSTFTPAETEPKVINEKNIE